MYADLLNRGAVVVTTILGIVLTFFAPQGMLNRIAYIGTGGLISMLVGPTIIRTFIEGNLLTCLLSMLTGFFGNVYLVLIYGKFGWVEAPIIAGIAGSLVYMIVGYGRQRNETTAPRQRGCRCLKTGPLTCQPHTPRPRLSFCHV